MSINNKNNAGTRVFGVRRPASTAAGAHAVLVADHMVNVQVDLATGSQTHTLPVAGTWAGGTLWGAVVRNAGANTCTIAAPVGGTINGAATVVLTATNDYIVVSAPTPGTTDWTVQSCQITPAG